MQRHFIKKEFPNTPKNVFEKGSTLLVIREMQSKTTIRYHRDPGHALLHDMGGGFTGKNSLTCTLKDLCILLYISYLNKNVS